MKIQTEKKEGVLILHIDEKLVSAPLTAEFKKKLLTFIVQQSPNLVVNLNQVQEIDSSGLGALLFGLRQAKRYGGVLKLAQLQPKVRQLIEIAQLARVFEIFDNEKQALRSFTLADGKQKQAN